MLKLRTLLLACALIFSQTDILQAASSRESISDGVTLLNKDAETLLTAIKEFMQITSGESAQQAAEEESLERPVSKRCTGLSTCMLGKLSQDIHKLQTSPRTNVGAKTPGKKRGQSELYEGESNSFNLFPSTLSV
ncbi:calcitonin/calcitonin-related polypeptide, alpha isoform X1 [Nothobranchius furzeri]|uniref:Transcript variant X1 n=1 Tax=Nothobranchius furzeri TaxID=105023 RepID=A0A9D3BKU3_NOTFU|nr:calcitonin/calcitonin-related polypeptide, alpha isoform X1 [Nothobranchius furzeri]KAF7212036.1 transcript variant X1 [Nothobranchius furzeri]